ncbi:hydroxymethylglutaryl-CoA synthase [Limosilactobacillus reuteri]|jgi:hydroxymethylglutaryl-CoA synthase|uniref:Hydroxymethylglutaryl-CoA synthase n=3 Tax=Limosilactobacillus reuteri TaxID=1598 RepID=A0A1V4FLX7_LIMRT|nr:hydroxymethylglutaryl-CoA synthase [Limosilactobacillus reuteri]CCC03029.1 hydroxymethylglutaryl-CoA synthase [Limosilactobacillus reuteri subsp. suis]AGN99440.1 hydroxymethylglutaryl-CoA synthase [Limosilactobacillus reuteri I5007]AMY13421.1 hydroxymethylglutaryl-CoA synthase [Limosilactobacillus reuteri]MCC4340101.1 hydroxymethylglutaryl-CoA synthase [Limosilactobacillus reuteri]MCC4346546.1 hydroxymethylglutaryl-CoA synthase [Limosilactobacillus reuteri]
MRIGIDRMAFATTNDYLDLVELAKERGVDPNKFTIGIGQDLQAVVPPTQDIVTLGATAAKKLLTPELEKNISTVIVATESGIDNSKASAIYIKHLLGLSDFTRTVEMKEACYSATAAIQFAKGVVALNPQETVLVIAADIARYGLNTPGEVTQGAGAVAMLISRNPHILTLEDTTVAYSKDIMDFWRPLYATEALVDGKYSTNVYIEFFLQTFTRYQQLTGRELADFAALTFHMPFTKMGKKGLEGLLKDRNDEVAQRLRTQLTASQLFSRQVGNLYTGSLYLSLMSLLQNSDLRAGSRIGLFSYGSGAEGEFYTGILEDGYEHYMNNIQEELKHRHQVSVAEYEKLFSSQLGMNDRDIEFDVTNDPLPFVLKGQKDHQRIYEAK